MVNYHSKLLQFAYTGAQAIRRSYTHFGQGSGYIVLDGVNCIGTEDRLINCSASASVYYGCNHNTDAGVKCQERAGKT